MTRYGDLSDTHREYLATHCVLSIGGWLKVICPLCTKEHTLCRFSAGSLSCVDAWCTNPHHRSPRKRKRKANVPSA